MTTEVPELNQAIPPPPPTSPAPPPPVPPPDLVRLRVDLPGADYRRLRHISIETAVSVNEMACEGIRMLLRWYAAQRVPVQRPSP